MRKKGKPGPNSKPRTQDGVNSESRAGQTKTQDDCKALWAYELVIPTISNTRKALSHYKSNLTGGTWGRWRADQSLAASNEPQALSAVYRSRPHTKCRMCSIRIKSGKTYLEQNNAASNQHANMLLEMTVFAQARSLV